jgi:hypothetical protein
VFDQSTLVLEGVTLAQVVKLVVQVLVDLATGPVLCEETSQNAKTAHPQHLAAIRQTHPTSSSSLQD